MIKKVIFLFIFFCILASKLAFAVDHASSEILYDNYDDFYDEEVYDPFEPANRVIFKFNQTIDGILIKPLALIYRDVVPDNCRHGVNNLLKNLKEPVTLINDILQFNFNNASKTLSRFLVNTILGFGGIFNVSKEIGLERSEEDFGKTIAKAGFGKGPFLMLPIIGPSNVRDSIGLIVDFFVFDPLNYYSRRHDYPSIQYTRTILNSINERSNLIEILDDIYESIDPYTRIKIYYDTNRDAYTKDEQQLYQILSEDYNLW